MKIRKTDQYDRWIKKLKDVVARAKINARIRRIEVTGTVVGDWKVIAGKLIEMRFDVGPGYRVYAHRSGDELLLLLIGGDKSTQRADIKKARELLSEWESRDGR